MKYLVLLLALCSSGFATCTGVCVQTSALASATVGTTCKPTLSGTRTAGHLLVAQLTINSTTITLTATDTDGNTWTDDAQESGTSGLKVHILSAKTTAGGSAAYTLTINASATINAAQCDVAEFNFNAYTNPYTFDKTAGAEGSSASASSGASPSLTNANELVIGVIGEALGTSRTIAAGTNYTLMLDNGATAGTLRSGWEYQNVASTTGIAATFTLGGTIAWDTLVATYYGTTGGGGATCTPTMTLMGVGSCG